MDQVHVIRHMVLNQGKSQRAVAREMRVSRNTVSKYLSQSEPFRHERKPRATPVLDRVRARIDELLTEWKGRTTAKQRVTGTRLHQQLREEGYEVGVTTVRGYLREKRRHAAEVFIPLVHRPGDSAQVDFFEVTVDLGGKRRKVWKFVARLMHSGRDFVWLYEHCDQVSFLEGHVRAFAHFGGVPQRMVYDNLTSAVKGRVGHTRELTERFVALASHFAFEPCFARVGEGHDKGGVEGRGKTIRLRHLTPIPRGRSLEELSRELQASIDRVAQRERNRQGESVMERFERERAYLRPLPPTEFEPACVRPGIAVSSKATVRIGNATYSTPCHWASDRATAYVGVTTIRLVRRGEETVHRKVASGGRSIVYRHYLPELARKPQAVRQVAPELLAELGEPFAGFWTDLSRVHEPLEAARLFARVLRMILTHGEEKVRRVMARLSAGGRLEFLALAAALQPRDERPESSVPESLRGYHIARARAAEFDHLLEGGRP